MASFGLAGTQVVADYQGALWWPEQRLLVFADLHFEKGSSYAKRTTQMLPPYDTLATLRVMQGILERYEPQCVVCLGDNFHDPDGPARLDAKSRATIHSFMVKRRFVWIEGNHDAAAASLLGGESAAFLSIGPLHFRHEPLSEGDVVGEVAGHLHPSVTITTRANRVRRKCFVTDGSRCVLPSLGAFTGGLDVFDDAFSNLFAVTFTTYALGRERVYPFHYKSMRTTQRGLAPGIGLKLR